MKREERFVRLKVVIMAWMRAVLLEIVTVPGFRENQEGKLTDRRRRV